MACSRALLSSLRLPYNVLKVAGAPLCILVIMLVNTVIPLIDSMSDSLRLQLHKPVRRNVALVTDAPWEGNACAYSSVFHDGDKFRMYYTTNHYVNREGRIEEPHGRHLCYAESTDGIRFTKPNLGLVEFEGSSRNNIVLGPTTVPGIRLDPGHTTILRDTNPDCPLDE